jgi:2'-5' RNA ligase
MANYVVIARFDNETNEKLNTLRKHLCEEGYIKAISEWPPHITIAAYENVDIHALLQWTEEFSKKYLTFDVMLASLGVLPPGGERTETAVLYASPSQSIDLIEFYYAFHEKLDEHCGNLGWWYSKKFGYPAIHSTIGIFEVAQMQKAMELIFEQRIFGKAKIIALEVYTYPMELIERFDLMEV